MRRSVVAVLGNLLLVAGAVTGVSKRTSSLVPRVWNGTEYGCKCYYDDSCWPSSNDWASLNTTVDGNLIIDIPPGAPCHNTFNGPLGTVETYDAAKCANVTANFADEQWTTDQPAAELWTYFTNETCRPTTNPSDPCTLGFYPVYVILAKTEDHIKAGIDFARTNNLRLIVRNTGHDFIGRSTGWGSLVINTHSFQSVEFLGSFTGPGNYSGSAVTIGAGVQGRALFRQAHAQDPPLALVIGECPTVGVAGGFVQGAGHGPMTTLHGFAADNALEFKVLTADGEYKTANADENSDLFWALKGGGPAAFAVILTATFRTYEDVKSAGIILNINGTHTNDTDLLWDGIRTFHKYSNHFVDSGLYVYFEITPGSLHIQPFVGINKTAADMNNIVKPLFDDLNALGLPYSSVTKEYPTLFDLYIDMFEDEAAGTTAITGGWMFAHQDVAENNDGIVAAFQNVANNGGVMVGHMWDAGHGWPVPNSSTNPRFRNASDFVIIALPVASNATWEEKQAAQELLTYNLDEHFRQAGPNGCTYVNEADPYQPNWQDHFYGTNYDELYNIRKKWDPNGVFYAISTPGTEDWESDRLVFKAIERNAEEKAFMLRMMTDDPATYAQGTNLLLVPLRPEDIDKDLERLSNVLFAVKICLVPEKADAKPTMIGWLHLDGHAMTRHHRSCQLGIMIASEYQGKGYGTEAINWALSWAFQVAGMHSVRLACFSFNDRAASLYRRLGFVQEGMRRESYYLNFKWHDHYLFSILDREWAALRGISL